MNNYAGKQEAGLETYDNEGESAESLGRKIFVGGLSWQTTEEGLRYYFEKFGELSDVVIMIDKRTGQPRGFGFVTLKELSAADLALAQEHTIDGRLVDVKRAVPRDKAPTATRSNNRHEFRKIFVGGLSPDVTEKELSDYFSKFGTVKDSVVMIDRKTSKSRGFGFVTFDSDDALNSVLRSEHEVNGKWVEVKRAEPREARPMDGMGIGMGSGMYDMRGGGGGGGGGGGMRRPGGGGGGGGRDDLYGGGGYPQEQYMPSTRNAYPYAGTALRNNYPAAAPQGGYARGGSGGGYNPGLAQGGGGGGYGYGGAVAGGGAAAVGPAGYYGGGAGYGGGYGGAVGQGQQQLGGGGVRGYGNAGVGMVGGAGGGAAQHQGYGGRGGGVSGPNGGVDPMMPVEGDDGEGDGGYGAAMRGQQQQQQAAMGMYGGGGYGAGGGGYGTGYGMAGAGAGGNHGPGGYGGGTAAVPGGGGGGGAPILPGGGGGVVEQGMGGGGYGNYRGQGQGVGVGGGAGPAAGRVERSYRPY